MKALTLSEDAFLDLGRQGYNRVALVQQVLADLETPLTLYLKLTGQASGSFLLESVVGGERFGRYSFIGLPTATRIEASGGETVLRRDGAIAERWAGNPLDAILAYQNRFRVAPQPELPRFCGGLAGYFGYDAIRYIEPKLAQFKTEGALPTPDILLLHTEEVAVIDNLSGKLHLLVWADPTQPGSYAQAQLRLGALAARLFDPSPVLDVLRSDWQRSTQAPGQPQQAIRSFDKADYLAAVASAKEYIVDGDMMQVQIGQRIAKPYTESPLSLYRALRTLNPSPYMYFYNFGEFQVVGASPEILVRQETVPEGQKVVIRPLAGTRPRGATPGEDVALEAELQADPKERAEHLMLIDLARNDLGRIAQTGSVKVTEAFVIERYSHVMHIVSHVEGLLREGLGNMDVLRATFPAGTLTGAPKIRAMEIIDELEPIKRGIYGGACGYLSYAGDMDLAIAIRTGIIHNGMLYVQAAAGVVADSVPEMEWRETEHKARALLAASDMVQSGF
ncbi:anthranilate synthase component I [Amphibiibacter pelophylacis]|uniref:Anthranilate synthase component I n=1 Tax=Amphibiibacter pelophylacis TaxID=1799477 RepID=A0ACC6P4V2_9BURK